MTPHHYWHPRPTLQPCKVKFIVSKKATQTFEIFTVDLKFTTYVCTYIYTGCKIDGEDFVKFCGLLRKYQLYLI